MNYYLTALKKYAEFSGRSRRSEYWFFALFNFIFLMVAILFDTMLGTDIEPMPYGVFYMIYALVVFIPNLAVFVRRMHDVDKSGWWIFIGLIPFVGAIWLLVLCLTEGTADDNEYGADPKAITVD